MSRMQSSDADMQPQSQPRPPQGQVPICTSSAEVPRQNPPVQQSSLGPADVTMFRNFSQAWLQAAAVDLQTQFPSPIVPAICSGHIYQIPKTQYPLYVPRGLWNVRCLSPRERHELYIEFCVFGHTMQRHGLGTPEYDSAFSLIVEKSREISLRERNWYAQFSGPPETYAQRAQAFGAIVAQQAHPVDIRSTQVGSRPGDTITTAVVIDEDSQSTTPHGQKRSAPSSPLVADQRPAKRITQEEEEVLRQQRAAKAEADHRRYMEQKQIIDAYYLESDRTRKPSDPEWQKLAVFDAHQAARQTARSTKKGKQPSAKQAEGSDADVVVCPKLPSLNLASYPMKTATTYTCLHIDFPCRGADDCKGRTHDCCRKGLSLRELEIAVRRQYERACARVEELVFMDGKLHRSHKTWDGWFSKKLRDRDSSREKAHLAPLGWSYDPRAFQAGSPDADFPSPMPMSMEQPQALIQVQKKRQKANPAPKPTSTEVGERVAPLPIQAPVQPREESAVPDDDPLLMAFMEAFDEEENGVETAGVEEVVAPEQPSVEESVQEDDPLLLALVAAFDEDGENVAEPNEGAPNVESTDSGAWDELDDELFGDLS